ncbi:PGF-pre-PGF domain-containing protein [Methanofollis formosanus]|uniref:PGF-pre-PGF domain-containing protein n=1 Tax=Methanofollis formosanus TaxID=299308 RepID=A0A8G1EF71_9EURY|nr:PGF-pre-PGF domain-containing protein [Methanofollis formosanus]QYZ78495.1 PGF-pre-PGF domain-containing protein [Methanofollis formosanus]
MRSLGTLIAAAMFLLLMTLAITPATAEPLPEPNHIFINVANDAGVKYDLDGAVFGTEGNNDTYYIKADGGGLNELCLTADPATPTGQITVSDQQSGTFYVGSVGGKGYFDDVIMAVAVNGTIPDDFAVHIKSSGYTWTPSDSPSNYTYVTDVVDEVFTKEDFIYGPQVQRPCPPRKGIQPFVYGQNQSDTANTFQFMFVDLYAGNLLDGAYSGLDDEGKGAVKVEYTFENLETTAAFNVYGWCLYAGQGQGISWTNDLIDQARGGSNGYSVIGIPPVLTSISVSPETAEVAQWDGVQFTATALEQRGREMKNVTFAWSSSDETVGTVNEDGYFMALSPGTTEITAANGTVSGTASVTVTAPSVPAMAPMSQNRHIFIDVANDAGVKYNLDGAVYGVWNNNTYYMKADGGGLNALHITADPATPTGQVTTSGNQSGTFYVSDTGGRGFNDDMVLLLAVNGSVPDDFAVHIKSSGYTWTPNPVRNQPPTNYTYVEGLVDETFTKEDFIYGPQTWKPGPGAIGPVGLPLYEGQDVGDAGNTFSLMFIDLNAGTLKDGRFAGLDDDGRGAVKVEYSFENLETFAAFNGYGWCLAANQGQGISWTNQVAGIGASGYSVVGIPRFLTSIALEPAGATVQARSGVQLTAHAIDQNGNEMPAPLLAWSSSDEAVGTVDAHGYFSALSAGTTTVTAANGTVNGTATLRVVPLPDSGDDDWALPSATKGLDAGASRTLTYHSGPISTVIVTVAKKTDDLKVTIRPVDTLPVEGPSGVVYRALEADLSHADDSSIKEAVFTFSVPLSWLKEQELTTQDVALMRYHDGRWTALPTEFVEETDAEAHYRAVSPGFSYFAITAMKGGASVQTDAGSATTETPAPAVTDAPATVEETTAPATTAPTQKSPVPWFLSIAAIGALFLLKRD